MSEALRATQATPGGDMRDPTYTDRVREDFDRLAVISEGSGWEHNSHYHPFLLRQLPQRLGEVLEVGCGTGEFTRLLAERCERVVAVDLSPRMIETARARLKDHPNVEYLVADAASWEFPSERFDCAASIATLHHLPLGPMLAKTRDALKPGGTLLLLDLHRARTAADRLVSALAVPISKAIRLASTGSLTERQAPELQKAWEEHGKTDAYPTLAEVSQAFAEAGLTGARVRRHVLYRYTVVWRKPLRE
jgi:ubiquinone/menaquinone biosynthesis C-methylase UbiE